MRSKREVSTTLRSALGRLHEPTRGESPWMFLAVFHDLIGTVEKTNYLYLAEMAIEKHTLCLGSAIVDNYVDNYQVAAIGWEFGRFTIHYRRTR